MIGGKKTREDLEKENRKLKEQIIQLKQKLEEEKREESFLNQYSCLFTKALMVGIGWDFISDKIEWSSNAAEVFNCIPEELPEDAKSFFEIIHPDDLVRVKEELEQKLIYDENRSDCSLEFRILFNSSDIIWIGANGKIFFSAEGKALSMFGILLDISKIKNQGRELEEKETILKSIFDYSPNQMYWKDCNLVYQGVNKSFADTMCAEPNDIIGVTNKQLLKNKSLVICCENTDKIVLESQKPLLGFEEEYIDPKGEKNYVLINKVPLFKEGVLDGILGISTDISMLKKTEREIELHKLRYQALFENSPMGMWDIDLTEVKNYLDAIKEKGIVDIKSYLQNNSNVFSEFIRKIKIIDVNKASLDFAGVKSKEELMQAYYNRKKIGKTDLLFIDGAVAVSDNSAELSVTEEVETVSGEKKHVFSKFSVNYGDNGYVHGILTFVDISNEVEIRKALIDSENRFKTIYESWGGGLGLVDLNGIVLDINKGGCKILGAEKEEVVGTFYYDYFDQKGKEKSWNLFLSLVAKPEYSMMERKYIRKDGSVVWGLVTITPMFDSNGVLQYFVVQVQDITAIKYVEEELQKSHDSYKELSNKYKQKNAQLRKALEQAERSEELKSEFLQNLSHEIRTPINAIIGFSNLMQEVDLDSGMRSQYLEIIESSSVHLLRLIEEIIEVSAVTTKKTKIKEKEFSVDTLFSNLYKQYSGVAAVKNLSFYLTKDSRYSDCRVVSDEENLKKIFDKLIDNAIKYTAKGFVDIGYIIENDDIYMFVRDTGVGVSEGVKSSILAPFSQAERGYNKKIYGLGLGLTFASEMTKLLNGNINIESELYKGSKFVIKLPGVVREKRKREISISRVAVNNILILEKDESCFRWLSSALKHVAIDFKTSQVQNEKELFRLLDEKQSKLIFVNSIYCNQSIKAFLKKIREIAPDIGVVILIDAEADMGDGEMCNEYCCIKKPIELNLLRNIVDKFR